MPITLPAPLLARSAGLLLCLLHLASAASENVAIPPPPEDAVTSPLRAQPSPYQSSPLVIVYSTFDGGNRALNAELVVPGVTTMFCESYGMQPFTVAGSPTCSNIPARNLTVALAAAVLRTVDYITVDELRPNDTCKEDCSTIVKMLAQAGLGGRILFYLRYSATNPHWAEHAGLIQARLDDYPLFHLPWYLTP